MNLLTSESKEKINQEYKSRLVVVFGIFLAVLFGIAVVLLLPSFFLLAFQESHLIRQMETSEQSIVLGQAKKIEQEVKKLKIKTELLHSNREKTETISPLFAEIIKAKPKRLSINFLIFQKKKIKQDEEKKEISQIDLRGRAETRTSLLDFTEKLKSNEYFSKVSSPVSNLLVDKDFDFSLNVYLNDRI